MLGTLGHVSLRWDNCSAVTVVMAAEGYPGAYEKGSVISGTEGAEASDDVMLFHAGTKIDDAGTVTAHGGRVLAVTGLGDDAGTARAAAYAAGARSDWPGGVCRSESASALPPRHKARHGGTDGPRTLRGRPGHSSV